MRARHAFNVHLLDDVNKKRNSVLLLVIQLQGVMRFVLLWHGFCLYYCGFVVENSGYVPKIALIS